MAKTTGNLTANFWNLQKQAPLRIVNATAGQVMGINYKHAPRSTVARLRAQSPLANSSILWNELDDSQKNDWSTVAQPYGLTGWQLFVQRGTDQQLRGPAELGAYSYSYAQYGFGSDEMNNFASTIANYNIGQIDITENDDVITLTQKHPVNYNIRRRIPQSAQVYETAAISESLILPLTIGLAYHTMLEQSGDSPEVEFYANIYYDSENGEQCYKQSISLGLADEWQRKTLLVPTNDLSILRYELIFSLSHVIGKIQFDNIEATHTGANWAIDPPCDNVDTVPIPQWGDVSPEWILDAGAGSAILTRENYNNLTIE